MRPLAVVGNVNVDLVVGPVAPWPVPGTEVMVEHDELRVGGAAGNAALAWAALGADFQIAANVGADQFGTWLREAFGARAARWPVEAGATTLSVGVTHPDGERTFLTTVGHLPALSLEKVVGGLDATALAGGLLLVCGSFLTTRLSARYGALFDWADRHGIDVALDTGWPLSGWTAETVGEARAWLSRSRHLLLNEAEAAALSGETAIEASAGRLAAAMPAGATVVVKCGAEGAFGRGPDGRAVHAPAPRVAVKDTIGAGDVFNAGYLLAIAEGRPLAEALARGVAVASAAVSTAPRRYDVP
jgi:sugar/nucleoside kinase (ribokinase family)